MVSSLPTTIIFQRGKLCGTSCPPLTRQTPRRDRHCAGRDASSARFLRREDNKREPKDSEYPPGNDHISHHWKRKINGIEHHLQSCVLMGNSDRSHEGNRSRSTKISQSQSKGNLGCLGYTVIWRFVLINTDWWFQRNA